MIRLLMNVPNLWWGGGMVNTLAVAKRLPPEDFQLCFSYVRAVDDALTVMAQHGQVEQIAPVTDMNKPGEQFEDLRRIIGDFQPDVVQANTLFAARMANERGIPCVTKAGSLRGIEVNGSNYADLTYRVSPAVPGDAPVNLFGVDPVPWPKQRQEHLVVWLGRIAPDRNPNLFLDAMALVAGRIPDVRVRMIGAVERGHLDMQHALIDRGLAGIVDWTGRLPHPEAMPLMAEGDVICAPCPEGSGTGVAEALTAGLIPVVPDTAYGPTLAEDGRSGIMTRPDARAVAEGIVQALTDEDLRKRRREIAQRARTVWDNDRTAATYERAYRNLAEKAEIKPVEHDEGLVERGLVWETQCEREDGQKHTVASYLSDKPWSDPHFRLKQWADVEWFPGELGDTVLDVGCNNANYARLMTEQFGLVYTGVDCSRTALADGWERNPGLDLHVGRLPMDEDDHSHLPFPDEAFDVVFCTDVLHHLPELRPALNELWRVARKWLVVHHRAVRAPGERIIQRGDHGEVMRFEMLADLCETMKHYDAQFQECHPKRGEVRTRLAVRLVEPYFVLRKDNR